MSLSKQKLPNLSPHSLPLKYKLEQNILTWKPLCIYIRECGSLWNFLFSSVAFRITDVYLFLGGNRKSISCNNKKKSALDGNIATYELKSKTHHGILWPWSMRWWWCDYTPSQSSLCAISISAMQSTVEQI